MGRQHFVKTKTKKKYTSYKSVTREEGNSRNAKHLCLRAVILFKSHIAAQKPHNSRNTSHVTFV